MITKARASVVGDYGNPSGTGSAIMALEDLPYSSNEVGTAQTAVQTFHAALVTADLTAAVLGDLAVSVVSESFPAKPEADVNVDRVLIYTWRTKQDSTIHRNTIHGVPATSTGIDKLPQGERLNETGKTALAAALTALYEIVAPNEVIVLQGKVLQKA